VVLCGVVLGCVLGLCGCVVLVLFEGLAYHVLSEEKVKRVISVVLNFEKITDVGELVRLCF
jgi:(2Fe-2S) ferredoxin